MRWRIGPAVVILAILTACGGGSGGVVLPTDPDAPVLQVRSEGGLVPVEQAYAWGPTYTLLADGRLIFQGPVIAIYPGPLLGNDQVIRLGQAQVDEIIELIEEVGLPDMVSERDDSATSNVADATTEVITFSDADGEHTYSVYALGIHPDPGPATSAAQRLVEALSTAAFSGTSEGYRGERARVLAGVSWVVPEPGFEDVRPWPLVGEDPAEWAQLESGIACKVFGPEVLGAFQDATQLTQWLHPDPMMDAPAFALWVRQLHPGEPDCPEN